jgi:hypothetical protein
MNAPELVDSVKKIYKISGSLLFAMHYTICTQSDRIDC